MSAWDKLRQAGGYLRKLRASLGPDSYSQYERKRNRERRQADYVREYERQSAGRERETAERERGYEERYTRDREGDVARERTERAEETEPDR